MDKLLVINDRLSIPASELKFRFSRSGGPGGQNVNKVETKVELLFDVSNSPSLSEEQKAAIFSRERKRIDSDGLLRITAQESRSQFENKEEAARKLAGLLAAALVRRKKRVKTKASKSSREKRIEGKKLRGKVKKMRGRVDY